MKIAIDFDGTIVEHKYPKIGKELPFAIATLKKLQSENHKLILWTVREGDLLNDAINFCRERGIEFYAINNDHPEEYSADEPESFKSRKLKADLFIDDRNIGGLPDWGVIYDMVHNGWDCRRYMDYVHGTSGREDKKGFWGKVFGGR